jgi:hypothetical protein
MTELVANHTTICIGTWDQGQLVTEPVLTEECMAAELEAYGLRDTADGRTTVREVFAKEFAEAQRGIRKYMRTFYGLM